MPEYAIVFARGARKELEKLPSPIVQRIFGKIETLALDPRPAGCKKLKGAYDLWRLRVSDYRVIYSILDAEVRIDIISVRHRRQAYD